jgi:hypothetical protein
MSSLADSSTMDMKTIRGVSLALLVFGTFSMSACQDQGVSDSLRTDGPINKSVEEFASIGSCAATGMAQSSFGARTLTNSGTSPVSVSDVSLIDSYNVTLYESVLVPNEIHPGRTLISPVPVNPRDYGKRKFHWEERVPAKGAEIASGETYELVLRIGPTAQGPGSFSQVAVTYIYNDETYIYQYDRSAEINVKSCN